MIRIVKPLVVFHWAALFSLLAALCVMAGDGGILQVFPALGLSVNHAPLAALSAPVVTSLVSLAFAVSAVLFWWALLATLLGDDGGDRESQQVVDLAFACASATLTVMLIVGVAHGVGGILQLVAIHVAALMVSYLAVSPGDRVERAADADERNRIDAVRKRAGEASHAASLVRLAARTSATGSD